MMVFSKELFNRAHLLFLFLLGSYPKTKPPPLLSLHRPPGLSLGAPPVRGPLSSSHNPYGPPSSRGPLLPHASPYHLGPRGPHGIRGAPPSLKSSRPALLSTPGVSFSQDFLNIILSQAIWLNLSASLFHIRSPSSTTEWPPALKSDWDPHTYT